MAETVVKTIENIDELFSQIVVNGEVHESTRYVPPVTAQTQTSSPSQSTQTSTSTEAVSDTPVRQTQGQDVYGVELNDVLHDFVDQRVTQALEEEVTAREDADTQLQTNIDNEVMARQQADYGLGQRITAIENVIPNQATPSNQLADKAFVNSSIATNTANFLGTYTSLADIEAIPNPTNNDYAYLETEDSAGNTLYDRYKYSAEDEQWLFEYELNNSSFTAEQWATINSGLTQSSVSSDISSAIEALDVSAVGGSGKYIKQISQTDGKITAVTGDITSSITSGSTDPVTSGAVADALAGITVTDADTAEKLKTARNLKVALGSATAQSFDGSANAESIGVGGTLPVANGGTGQTDLDNVTVGGAKKMVVATGNNNANDCYPSSANYAVFELPSTASNIPEALKSIIMCSASDVESSGRLNTIQYTQFLYNSGGMYTRTSSAVSTGGAWTFSWSDWHMVVLDNAVNAQSLCKPVTCDTAGSTSAKAVTLNGFNLVKGSRLLITMTNANTSASAITMNVNGTGAKTIRWNGSVTSSSAYAMTADTYSCYYDGTYWNMDSVMEAYSARTADSATNATNGVLGRLGGAFGTSKTNFTDLLNEISNASGGGGIVGGSINNVADKGIPAGWHNFLYIPHRSGIGGNNYQYGTLFVTDMTANTSNFWVIHKTSGTVNNAIKVNAELATQADYTRGTAYCTTAGATQAKVASMRGYVLQSGATFPITFTNANTYNGVITLNVNSTGAKNVYINNAVTSSSNKTLPAGTYLCRYNGSYYYIDTGYFVTNARNANYATSAGSATTANKIRTSAPSSPADGDIWIE